MLLQFIAWNEVFMQGLVLGKIAIISKVLEEYEILSLWLAVG
jgi:hypothetical protein